MRSHSVAAALGLVLLTLSLSAMPVAAADGTRYRDEVFPEVNVTADIAYG